MKRLLLTLLCAGRLMAVGTMGPELPEGGLPMDGIAIPADSWLGYFGDEAAGDLFDPQNLLSPDERKEREEFLRYHAGDSRIRMRVMLFEEGQRFPDDLDRLAKSRLGSEGPEALLMYVLGEPERAMLWFNGDLTEQVGSTEIARMLGKAAREAEEESVAVDQFTEFCVQLSIRLYWIERSLGWVADMPAEAPAPVVELIEGPSRSELILQSIRSAWKFGGVPFVSACGAFICLMLIRGLMGRRRRCRFPEFEIAPRLGGSHGAGIGAVMSFGSTTQSPSSQRERTTDCLGGI